MVADSFIASVAAKGFSGLLSNLATDYFRKKTKSINLTEDQIKSDFSNHLNVTFEKCVKVKTILNDSTPANTLQIYVDQTFKRDDVVVDQYDLVSQIRDGSSVIIVGNGGGGKSMFMRYLWLSYFERPSGTIPFFLELRQLKSYTHSNLKDFIFHSIVSSGSSISSNSFDLALRAGEFILFLDGFDEINYDQRDRVQRFIIDLKENNPCLTIVLTSRPDERFAGWVPFEIFSVEPMPLDRARNLIERAPYDEKLKERFLVKINDLYASHSSFISNPLLCYMMLVTFSFNPNIPSKMFLFYEQAFEALYHRHDLTKGGYRRKFHSKLEKQDFIRLLGYFCLKGYYDENYEFSYNLLFDTVEKAKGIEKIEVKTEDFINDMLHSICIIKKDGLSYNFTHRPFQEYFAAYCIARVASRNLEGLFAEFARRYEDNVLQMVYDINPDLFREKYIIPASKKYRNFLERKTTNLDFERMLFLLGGEFRISVRPEKDARQRSRTRPAFRQWLISLTYDGEFESYYKCVKKIDLIKKDEGSESRRKDDDKFCRALQKKYGFDQIYFIKSDGSKFTIYNEKNGALPDGDADDFRQTGMYRFIAYEAVSFRNAVNREIEKYRTVTDNFSELF